MAYCNTTTDLSDQYPDIARYTENRLLENWYATSGQSNTYEVRGSGQVNLVFDDGEQLAVQTTIALLRFFTVRRRSILMPILILLILPEIT